MKFIDSGYLLQLRNIARADARTWQDDNPILSRLDTGK